MANTTDTTAQPDPMQAVERLIEVLRNDIELRTESLHQLNQLIETRNELISKHNAENAKDLRDEMRTRIEEEHERNKRAKWYTGILGVFAVIIGAVLFFLVVMMAMDMNRMEDYMFNMGHAPGDHRIRKHELKTNGQSFMFSMAEDMQQMRADMAAMRGDMGEMRLSMGSMDGNMGTMSSDIRTMNSSMSNMTGTMGRMQYDTLLMRQGVGNMASDTGQMGVPFRVMNSVMPW